MRPMRRLNLQRVNDVIILGKIYIRDEHTGAVISIAFQMCCLLLGKCEPVLCIGRKHHFTMIKELP